jgi:hypothetical protein
LTVVLAAATASFKGFHERRKGYGSGKKHEERGWL